MRAPNTVTTTIIMRRLKMNTNTIKNTIIMITSMNTSTIMAFQTVTAMGTVMGTTVTIMIT
jgi:hypothetical protein